jgi:hypothetical protein
MQVSIFYRHSLSLWVEFLELFVLPLPTSQHGAGQFSSHTLSFLFVVLAFSDVIDESLLFFDKLPPFEFLYDASVDVLFFV